MLLQVSPIIEKEARKLSRGLPPEVRHFLEYDLIHIRSYHFTVFDLLMVLVVFLLARLLIVAVSGVLRRGIFRRRNVDKGRQEAVIQLLKYVVYTLSFVLILDISGVKLSLLLAGSAALLVGVGLGLQQTFNDLVSGLILLVEGSIQVGDIVEMNNGLVGRVTSIGLRTSELETRDSIGIIVPNSQFINNNIINWTHSKTTTRFIIEVPVSYRNDPDLVQAILLQCALDHPDVVKEPVPRVRLMRFGESGNIFEVLFWIYNPWPIEFIKSDIRLAIFKEFRANNIEIPYTQHDVYIRSNPREQPES
jgi:small-conductance mechanosensitive channel